jgi:putative restriction endonuclease
MDFWWVSQNRTAKQEIAGSYMWSPKRRKDGAYYQPYENMRHVTTGDIVFSFYGSQIRNLGIVTHPAVSFQCPPEFGKAGDAWSDDGWMVQVHWQSVGAPLRPKDIITDLRPHLPTKHSPLNPETGDGREVYLAAVPAGMAAILLAKLGVQREEIIGLAKYAGDDETLIRNAEDVIENQVRSDPNLDDTERQAVIKARRGQGRFRMNVAAIEPGCRVTGLTDHRLLRASHIKPWGTCATNKERVDGHNGLLLSHTVDHLFDRGYISFRDDGRMLISTKIDGSQLSMLGIACTPTMNVGPFTDGQRGYLAFHRAVVFGNG